jgi:hypothetical protein
MRMHILILVVLIFLDACISKNAINITPLEEIQATVTPATSTLPAYDLTGGVWVKDQPLLINQDFDFAMGMGLPDIGPAIAAGQRKKGNEEVAQLLEAMPPLRLDVILQKHMKDSTFKNPLEQITLYGILFGQPNAHLRVILETRNTQGEDEKNLRLIYVTDWASVRGEDSWTSNNGRKIIESFEAGIRALIAMMQVDLPRPQESEAVEYMVINGKAPQRGSGWILKKRDNRILIESKMIQNTILSLPESAVEINGIEDELPGR